MLRIAFFVGLLGGSAGCGEPLPPEGIGRAATVSPAGALQESDGARIRFQSTTHDFGRVSDAGSYTATYPFTNVGTQVLVLEAVKAGCKCAVPVVEKMEYAPGESGTIEVTVKPTGQEGSFSRVIHVSSNSAPNPLETLSFVCEVEPLLALERTTLDLGRVRRGAEVRVPFTATSHATDLLFVRATVDREYLEIRLVERKIEEGELRAKLELVVSPDAPWTILGGVKTARGRLYVRGTCLGNGEAVSASYPLVIQGRLFRELEPTLLSGYGQGQPGSIFYIGYVAPGKGFEPRLRLARESGAPFRILDTRIEGDHPPDMELRIDASGPASYELTLAGTVAGFHGPLRGQVILTTDVPGEETLRLDYQGSAR